MTKTCPQCDQEYDRKISLSSRHGSITNITNYRKLCQTAERRQGGPTMKPTRSDSEKYKFVGYLHE